MSNKVLDKDSFVCIFDKIPTTHEEFMKFRFVRPGKFNTESYEFFYSEIDEKTKEIKWIRYSNHWER